ncbi:hypothetical protein, partial [Escherichia coli]|uniref:hypothetical protein n=1 Tax=Escherichia coli TaxID=562 RepID=UPI0022DF9197
MMSLWDALRMNMMISYQELVRTFLSCRFVARGYGLPLSFLSAVCDTDFIRQYSFRIIQRFNLFFHRA